MAKTSRFFVLIATLALVLTFTAGSVSATDFTPEEAPSGTSQRNFLDTLIEGGSPKQGFQTNPYNQGLSELEVPNAYATQSRDPYALIGRIIRIALSFLGVGATALMVYAGVVWMTAAGNDDKVSEAKKTMRNAVIGLILITMSYSLTWYVVSRLQRATNTYGSSGSGAEGTGPTRGAF